MSDEVLAKGKLVSREILQAYLDRQPGVHYKASFAVDEAGEAEYLEATQTGTQPPVVRKAPEEE